MAERLAVTREASVARDSRAPTARRSRAAAGDVLPGRPSRLRLWLRRRRAWGRPAAVAVLAGGALAGVAVLVLALDPAARLAALSARFTGLGTASLALTEVVLEGRRNTPLEALRQALGVRLGDPMLALSPTEIRDRVQQIPWVRSVEVERRLPGTLRLRITEHEPFAIWQREGRFSVITRAGSVVASENAGAFGDLPLVVGVGADRVAAPMVDLLRAQPDLADRTQALVRVGERRWNIRLRNGADILLPEGQEAAAIIRLVELQRAQGLLDRPLASLDLRLPDRMVIRLPAATPAATPAAPTPGAPPTPQRSGRG
jgi:cell division protein FtsQ